jgi:hypothetical protein
MSEGTAHVEVANLEHFRQWSSSVPPPPYYDARTNALDQDDDDDDDEDVLMTFVLGRDEKRWSSSSFSVLDREEQKLAVTLLRLLLVLVVCCPLVAMLTARHWARLYTQFFLDGLCTANDGVGIPVDCSKVTCSCCFQQEVWDPTSLDSWSSWRDSSGDGFWTWDNWNPTSRDFWILGETKCSDL